MFYYYFLEKKTQETPQSTTEHENTMKTCKQDARRHAEGKYAPRDEIIGIMQKQPKFFDQEKHHLALVPKFQPNTKNTHWRENRHGRHQTAQ